MVRATSAACVDERGAEHTLGIILHPEIGVRPPGGADAVARAQLDRAGVVVFRDAEQAAVEVIDVARDVHVRRGGRDGGGPGDGAGGKGRGGEVGGGVDLHGVAAAADLAAAAAAGQVAVGGEPLADVEILAAEALVGVLDAEVGVGARGAVVAVCGAVFDAGDAKVVGAVDGARAGEVCVAVLVQIGAGLLDDGGACR